MSRIGHSSNARSLRRAKAARCRSHTVLVVLGLSLLASGCTTASQVSTRFYDVKGQTSRDLDRDIRRKGPMGGKAIAMAGIDIQPANLELDAGERGCRFRKARFRVKADLTLPRWPEAALSQDAELREGWKGFAAYAKAHEEAHVRIAEAFAGALERAFLAIPPQPSCARLELVAQDLARRAGRAHNKAQLTFDATEQKRLTQLFAEARRTRTR